MTNTKNDLGDASWESKDESTFFVNLFWLQLKLLVCYSTVCALFAFLFNLLGIFNARLFQILDHKIVSIFQGFLSLSVSFENDFAIRFYFYCMSLACIFILLKIAKKMKNIDFKLSKTKNRIAFILMASSIFVLNWMFILLNEKVIAASLMGRGLIVYTAMANNFFLLAILGWMFYFLIVVSFSIILKITIQFKQSY